MTMFRADPSAFSGIPGRDVQSLACVHPQAPTQTPARPGERQVGNGREARLIRAERQQKVRGPVARRQQRVRDIHAVAVHAPSSGADEQRARFPHQPCAEPPGLEHEPAASVQLAGPTVDEVAEQPERHVLGSASLPPGRLDHPSATGGVQLGDRPCVRQAQQCERQQDRSRKAEQQCRRHERERFGQGRERPQPAGPPQRALIGTPPPADIRELRQRGPDLGGRRRRRRAQGSASDDLAAQDDEVGVERKLAHLLGAAGAVRHQAEVAPIELGSESVAAASALNESLAVHSATVVWPLWSILMSRDMRPPS